jgi:hypothetical protein
VDSQPGHWLSPTVGVRNEVHLKLDLLSGSPISPAWPSAIETP